MSTATAKEQYSRDEADIRPLIETVHKAHHARTPLPSLPGTLETRLCSVSRRHFLILEWILKKRRRGSTPGKGQSI
jgi:hypothetical protein